MIYYAGICKGKIEFNLGEGLSTFSINRLAKIIEKICPLLIGFFLLHLGKRAKHRMSFRMVLNNWGKRM